MTSKWTSLSPTGGSARRIIPARLLTDVTHSPGQPARTREKLKRTVKVQAHPDALERNLQREVRRLERMQIMEVESMSHWWENAHPPNVRVITRKDQFHAYRAAVMRPNARPAIMHYFSQDCPGCKRMHPKVMQIVGEQPFVDFFKVHTGKLQAECEEMRITTLPYFQLYHAGEEVAAFSCNLGSIQALRRGLADLEAREGEARAAAALNGAAPFSVSALSTMSLDEALMSIDDFVREGGSVIAGGGGGDPGLGGGPPVRLAMRRRGGQKEAGDVGGEGGISQLR